MSGFHLSAMEELRIAKDNVAYSLAQFREYYGDAAEWVWNQALPVNSSIASAKKYGITRNDESTSMIVELAAIRKEICACSKQITNMAEVLAELRAAQLESLRMQHLELREELLQVHDSVRRLHTELVASTAAEAEQQQQRQQRRRISDIELRHDIAEILVWLHSLHAQLAACRTRVGAEDVAPLGMPAAVRLHNAQLASERLSQSGLGTIMPRAGSEASTEPGELLGRVQAATEMTSQMQGHDSQSAIRD